MRKPGLILLAGLLVAACDSGSKAPPPDLIKSQREAMEKAFAPYREHAYIRPYRAADTARQQAIKERREAYESKVASYQEQYAKKLAEQQAQQPVKTGKVVHVGVGHENVAYLQDIP